MTSRSDSFYFINSSSEIADLYRNIDWKRHGLGEPESWSTNLKAALNISIASGMPIALFWGADNIILYNEAYSKILGDKHPGALGKPARLVLKEVWNQFQESFELATAKKELTRMSNMLVPIRRFGYVEECYFDYTLAPIVGENGDTEGIFNSVIETTYTVINERRISFVNEMIQLLSGIDSIAEIFNVVISRLKTSTTDIPYALFFANDARAGQPTLQYTVNLPETITDSINWSSFFSGTPTVPTLISPDLMKNAIPESACWPEPCAEALILPLIVNNETTGYFVWGISPRKKADNNYLHFLESIASQIGSALSRATEREEEKRTHYQLEKTEADFRNLIMQAPIGIGILHSESFEVQQANDRLLSTFGKSTDEVLGNSLWSILNEFNGIPYAGIVREALKGQSAFHGEEFRIEIPGLPEPEVKYIDFTFQPLYNHNGESDRMLLICSDSTEKVNIRLQIEESEKRLLSVLIETPVATAILMGPEMRVAMFNEPMLKIWQKDQSLMGKPLLEAIPELVGQPFPEIWDKVYSSGETYVAKEELAYFNVDGVLKPGYFDYSYTAMRTASGTVYGILVLANDVTDSVLIKKRIEKNEQNFRNLIHHAPVAMCLLSGPEHSITIANQRMYDLWGKNREDVFQKPIAIALPELSGQGFNEMLDNVYKTGETISAIEVPVTLNYNGKPETVFVNFVYEVYKESEDTISGIMVVASDVTVQVHAKQKIGEVVASRTRELAEANLNLQNINAQLEQFAYIASHDLQEPVRKVSNFTQMLQHSLGTVDDKSQHLLNKITDSTSRMLNLIRDVLAYSQLSKQKQSFESVDLNEVIKNIKQDFELLIEQKQAKIVVNKLPTINAIPLQITQLFSNLLSNALKFTKPGQLPEISILATPLNEADIKFEGLRLDIDSYYMIEFRDNGIGFPQENASQIFNIFQRLHGRAEYAGTGIGLALCKKIVQNHSGYIYALSGKDEGATFNIIIPSNPSTF